MTSIWAWGAGYGPALSKRSAVMVTPVYYIDEWSNDAQAVFNVLQSMPLIAVTEREDVTWIVYGR